MATKTPPPRSTTLHSAAGTLLAASEATSLAAGDTIQYQNTGNVLLRVVVTTAGTGTVQGLNAANNIPLTLAVGNNLLGPYDPTLYGSTVNITTATAIGSVATYIIGTRFLNGQRNPFETDATKPDGN